MSCNATATFRLLDAYVGWDAAVDPAPVIIGLDDPAGIRLGPDIPGAVDPEILDRWLGIPALARACHACVWYLAIPGPHGSLRWRDPCGDVDARGCLPFVAHPAWTGLLEDPVAVAAGRPGVAVADRARGAVVWRRPSGRIAPVVIAVAGVAALAFGSRGELLVATGSTIRRFDASGVEYAPLPAAPGRILRLRAALDGVVWIAVEGASAPTLWSHTRGSAAFVRRTQDDLVQALAPVGLSATGPRGFCLQEPTASGFDRTCCYGLRGAPLEAEDVGSGTRASLHTSAELRTEPLDSEIPRCRWHRVRIDADVPVGTSVQVQVATSEDGSAPDDSDFAGVAARGNACDFLIDQPPGRYLFVRVLLRGDGRVTPRVRRVRLDMPRVTSADLLPAVYREEPAADDFTERFVSLFDAPIEELDAVIERFTAALDARDVPSDLLPWLGTFVGMAFEPHVPASVRRRLLQAAAELFRLRGTLAGLRRVIEIVTGHDPVIREPARESAYGALGSAALGQVRLFGRLRARFRLDASRLGSAPLLATGNPDADPLTSQAWRIDISVANTGEVDRETFSRRLQALVDGHKPAHVVARVRVGSDAFVIGPHTLLGVDTQLGSLPAPVLGRQGNVRLRRNAVLRRRAAL